MSEIHDMDVFGRLYGGHQFVPAESQPYAAPDNVGSEEDRDVIAQPPYAAPENIGSEAVRGAVVQPRWVTIADRTGATAWVLLNPDGTIVPHDSTDEHVTYKQEDAREKWDEPIDEQPVVPAEPRPYAAPDSVGSEEKRMRKSPKNPEDWRIYEGWGTAAAAFVRVDTEARANIGRLALTKSARLRRGMVLLTKFSPIEVPIGMAIPLPEEAITWPIITGTIIALAKKRHELKNGEL